MDRVHLRGADQAGVLSRLVGVLARQGRPEVTRLFGTLARSEEEQARAREQLARRVRDDPAAAAPRLELARFLVRQGQLAAARNQLERAAEAGPAASRPRALLADVERWLRASLGSSKVKVLPFSSSLSTQIRPPCNSTNSWQMYKPSPMPVPVAASPSLIW